MPLYVVATPIGNLEDITHRAVRVLGEADAVAAEDTRKTGRLLEHYGLRKPLISYHEHNEPARAEQIVRRVAEGQSIALVCNSGTPSISDPGYRVVRRCIDEGLEVIPVPGPCASIAALSASGLPMHAFHFAGFLAKKPGRRRSQLRELGALDATIAVYESPYRVAKLLEDVREVLGERPVCLARELTKSFEEFLRGTPSELLERLAARPPKGEFVVLIGPEGRAAKRSGDPEGPGDG
jgi:16S rRNA (cytidine1402-2'-O)-methyltransferase